MDFLLSPVDLFRNPVDLYVGFNVECGPLTEFSVLLFRCNLLSVASPVDFFVAIKITQRHFFTGWHPK